LFLWQIQARRRLHPPAAELTMLMGR